MVFVKEIFLEKHYIRYFHGGEWFSAKTVLSQEQFKLEDEFF